MRGEISILLLNIVVEVLLSLHSEFIPEGSNLRQLFFVVLVDVQR